MNKNKYNPLAYIFATLTVKMDDYFHMVKDQDLIDAGNSTITISFLPKNIWRERLHTWLSMFLYLQLVLGVPFILLGLFAEAQHLVYLGIICPAFFSIVCFPLVMFSYTNRYIRGVGTNNVNSREIEVFLLESCLKGTHGSVYIPKANITEVVEHNDYTLEVGLIDKPIYKLWLKNKSYFIFRFKSIEDKKTFENWYRI